MDRDDIIRMARMSADYWANHYDRKSKADMELLRKHVAEKFLEIAAAEREECAKVCQDLYANLNDDLDCRKRWPEQKRRNDIYAAAIRARGQG